MNQYPEYLRYLEEAKRAEFADHLRSTGFTVEPEKQSGDVRFDLFAEKGFERRVYEFNSVGSKRLPRGVVLKLQRAARDAGYQFHMVIVNPPPRVNIQADNLTSQLREHLADHMPPELSSLPGEASVQSLRDLEVSDIRFSGSGTVVQGRASLGILVESGDSNEPPFEEVFPLVFKAELGDHNRLSRVTDLKVDTTSFYE